MFHNIVLCFNDSAVEDCRKRRKCSQLASSPFYTLPNNKILDWSKLQVFADDK